MYFDYHLTSFRKKYQKRVKKHAFLYIEGEPSYKDPQQTQSVQGTGSKRKNITKTQQVPPGIKHSRLRSCDPIEYHVVFLNPNRAHDERHQ